MTRRLPLQICTIALVCAVLACSTVARAQSLDRSFDPGANNPVYAFAVQPDGKIVGSGNFTTLGGGTRTTTRSYIGRLNADRSLDTSFDPGANGYVSSVALQSDGKTLVCGNFTTLGGGGTGTVPRKYLARLNADGSVDTNFNPGTTKFVANVAVQPDGKILITGGFPPPDRYGTPMVDGVSRLNTGRRVGQWRGPGFDDAGVSIAPPRGLD